MVPCWVGIHPNPSSKGRASHTGSILHAHEDIIRAFAVNPAMGSFASVSNDCMIKVLLLRLITVIDA